MDRCHLRVFAGALALGLASCGGGGFSGGPNPTGTGPFDDRGNYVEEWADNPSKWNGRSVPTPSRPADTRVVSNNTPPPVITPLPEPTPRPVARTTTVTTPKPKPVAPKPKPKPKPTSITHTVKKGDTLFGLAKRYGTTVSGIQKSSGLKGTTIRIGQKLTIPR